MGKITINEDRCKGCELCIDACPYGLLIMSTEVNHFGYHTAKFINGDKCTACKFCGMMCPDFAIDVYK
ncbi:MAG: NAD(P)H-quinone oxidoreductase subunit I, chloroplastic [Candidatus Scalindua arabica]|uniref:NAD(P)H-quinone oxidoreductase subunit I, chloroplastic n=1 Tax=Candidatus Scalindua arabica TaxID=1127984 RepID=A0A941W4Y3_9BACT|nr:NAD(P)H-quinone oxidoreductase subunit I, chloroplastic [Candidatus Scalindua arabica]